MAKEIRGMASDVSSCLLGQEHRLHNKAASKMYVILKSWQKAIRRKRVLYKRQIASIVRNHAANNERLF